MTGNDSVRPLGPRRASGGTSFWARARQRWLLRRCEVGADVRIVGHVWVYGGGRVRLGDRVVLDASWAPIELHAERGAEIVLGEDVFVEGGVSIEAVDSVTIEARAVVGAFTKILDNHFHPVVGDRSERPRSSPIHVGAGSRIGRRCVLLPGARLEEGVRLGHGVVIGRRVPAGAALEGSPPRRVSPRSSS